MDHRRSATASRAASVLGAAVRSVVLAVALAASVHSVSAPAAEPPELGAWDVRRYDMIYRGDSAPIECTILLDEGGVIRYRDRRTGAVGQVARSEVREVKPKAVAEELLEQQFRKYKGSPDAQARIAREALKHFPEHRGVKAKLVKLLEEEASQGAPELLDLLVQRYLAAGDPAAAEIAARKLVARRDSGAARFLLGQALAGQGKTKEAEETLRQALRGSPESEEIRVALAEALLAGGKPEEARKLFEPILEKNPRSAPALLGLGIVHLREGNLEEANKTFAKATEADSKCARAYVAQAACRLLAQDTVEAYRLAGQARDYDPKSGAAFALQGFALLASTDGDKLADAGKKIDDALELAAGEPRIVALKAAYLERAALLDEAAGRPAEGTLKRNEANRLWEELAKANPPDAWLQFVLAERALRRNDFDTAAAGYKRAAELEDSYVLAHQALGAVALRQRRWAEAESAYQRALQRTGEKDPRRAELCAGLGLALLGMSNRPAEAEAALRQAKGLDPNNVTALLGLGYIANYERKEEVARALFQQALALDGRSAYAADALKRIYSQRGLRLDYLNFDQPLPKDWTVRGSGALRPEVKDGQLAWRGTQSSASGVKSECFVTVKAADFVRLEADLQISSGSPATLGLRLASAPGSATRFEIEFGKNDAKDIAFRILDYTGKTSDWIAIAPWPADGRARLTLEAKDLSTGELFFIINGGQPQKPKDLRLIQTGRMTVGFFLQCPAKETIEAGVDNVILLVRKEAGEPDDEGRELVPVAPKPPEPAGEKK